MVGHAKWISLTALSLLLTWQNLPAQAQRFAVEEDEAPAQLAPPTDDLYFGEDDGEETLIEIAPGDDGIEMDDIEMDGADEIEVYEEEPVEIDADGSDALETDEGAAHQHGETIKERYPNGRVKIEREVTQDAAGNYLNHGSWKMWDEQGRIVAQGQYRYGNRTGTWIRWYRDPKEISLWRTAPYNVFRGPLVSQATFENDKLNGFWTIYDGKLNKISQWRFVDGRRHGPSVWWHNNGKKMREIEYRDGDIDGHLIEWGSEGSVLTRETYQQGRKLAQKTAYHKGGKQKKSEGMYLFAKDTEKTPDDWWTCTLKTTVKTGDDERHGPWTSWHPNGQRHLEGTYDHDMQVGLFTWWHANGQKALEGRYNHGKQDGPWVWWHENGQKKIQGEYAQGNPTGRWTWWAEDGRVAQSADLSSSEGIVIQTLPKQPPSILPQARRPAQRR